MKHSMSIMMATIMMVIFGGSTYAQTPDWLDGKWLAAGEIYVIEGNQIEKITGEGPVQLGEFVLDEDNSLWVDGRPLGLIASPEKQALVYETNPGRAFPKYEELSLGSKYSWVAGSWTDGSDVLTFTEKEVSFKKSGNVVDKGIFFIDENGLIDVYWENDSFSEGLMACGDAIAYQGGDRLVKIPEHADEGAEGTDLIASLTESSTPYEGDVKWVYGRWTMPDSREEIYITPKYYQARGANDSYLAGKEITELEKVEYTVMEEKNQVRGDVIRLGDYYLDTTEKLLYSFTGIDGRNYLEQTEKYVSPVIRYGKWVLLGLAGIAAIVFLVILLIRLIKKMVASFKKWRQKTKAKLVIKTQETKEKAQALGKKAKEAKAAVIEKYAGNDKTAKKKPSAALWWLLAGLYFLFFLSIVIGVIILIPTIIYLVLSKKNPEKAEVLLSSCKSKLSAITSRPKLERGLVLLLAGILAFKLVGMLIGLFLILFALFYLICSKTAPGIIEKIDAFLLPIDEGVKKIWAKPYARIIICCLLVVYPFLSSAPTQGVATVVAPAIEEAAGIEQTDQDYSWIKGTWAMYESGAVILVTFKPEGKTYGTYAQGSNFSRSILTGDYTISDNSIWMREPGISVATRIMIEGRKLRDVNGKYWMRR